MIHSHYLRQERGSRPNTAGLTVSWQPGIKDSLCLFVSAGYSSGQFQSPFDALIF